MEDIPVATLRPNGGGVAIYYVHTDHLNTPQRVSRPSDDVIVWRWDSDPFGTDAANQDPDGDATQFAYNLRFPGQYFDAETGLSYNYFRDYDPQIGRYVESDPVGLKGGINTYAYAKGNAVGASDPFGLEPALLPFEPNANITCCVNGRMSICMNDPKNKLWKCQIIRDSWEVHEMNHLGEFRVKAPSICVGVPGRRTIGYTTWDEWRRTEMDAFNKQLDFLARKKNQACLSPDCENELPQYINWILGTAIPGVMAGTYGR